MHGPGVVYWRRVRGCEDEEGARHREVNETRLQDRTRLAAGITKAGGPWFYRRLWVPEALVLLGLVAGTSIVFGLTDLDLVITRLFFSGQSKPFVLHLSFPWRFLYATVAIPLAAAVVASAVLLAGSYFAPRLRALRLHLIYALLVIAVGPGLVVNVLLKGVWDRPRPRQVEEFGGRWPYQPVHSIGAVAHGKSFPCGHAAAGYAFAFLYFIFRRRRRRLGLLALAAALVYGTALGIGRVVSGSHFASDVAWAALLVFGIAFGLYYFVLNLPGREDGFTPAELERPESPRTVFAWTGLTAATAAGLLLAVPFHADIAQEIPMPGSGPVDLRLGFSRADVRLQFDGRSAIRIDGTADGFGSPGAALHRHVHPQTRTHPLEFELHNGGVFSELNVPIEVRLPPGGVRRLGIAIARGDLTVCPSPGPTPAVDIEVQRGDVTLPAAWSNTAVRVTARRGTIRYADVAATDRDRTPRDRPPADSSDGY